MSLLAMSATPFIYLSLLLFVPLCCSSFTEGSSTMPYESNALAIGYDASNDTILLFGGDPYRRQFTTFKNHAFIEIDSSFLTKDQQTDSYSQHYSQLNHQLWIIRDDSGGFIKIDTKTYNVESPSISIPINVNIGGCLTSIDNYLIVVAGRTSKDLPLDIVQIYRLSDDEWISNVPSLNTPRTSLSCVIVSNQVYAIGGIDSNTHYLDSIEVLDITNIGAISSASWSPFTDTLSIAVEGTRAAVYQTDIYVIGGEVEGRQSVTNVDIIDTTTGSVIAGDPLSVAVAWASCVVVRNTLFAFGGFAGDTHSKNIYQYLTLPTYNPSSIPTNNPTHNTISTLSSDVSSNPTLVPVDYTTTSLYDSTKDTTSSQTNNPTVITTSATQKPEPTTYDATIDTNDVTTKYPFIEPSIHPTIETSYSPSERGGEVQEISSTVDASSQERTINEYTNDSSLTVAMIGGIICVICCILSFVGYCLWRHSKHKTNIQNMVNNPDGLNKLDDNNTIKIVEMKTSNGNGEPVLFNEKVEGIIQRSDSDDDDLLDVVNRTIGENEFGSAVNKKAMDRMENDNTLEDELNEDEFVVGSDSDRDDDDNAFKDGGNDNFNTFIEGDKTHCELNEDGAKEVKSWLDSIGFSRYYDVFIQNGFHSMDYVNEINDVKDLDGIGISLRAHQLKIVNQIKKLKK